MRSANALCVQYHTQFIFDWSSIDEWKMRWIFPEILNSSSPLLHYCICIRSCASDAHICNTKWREEQKLFIILFGNRMCVRAHIVHTPQFHMCVCKCYEVKAGSMFFHQKLNELQHFLVFKAGHLSFAIAFIMQSTDGCSSFVESFNSKTIIQTIQIRSLWLCVCFRFYSDCVPMKSKVLLAVSPRQQLHNKMDKNNLRCS